MNTEQNPGVKTKNLTGSLFTVPFSCLFCGSFAAIIMEDFFEDTLLQRDTAINETKIEV